MKLDVKRLVQAPVGESDTFDLKLSSQKIDDEGSADITGTIKLTKLEDELLCEFKGVASLKTTCDRCAGDYVEKINLSFSEEYFLFAGKDNQDENTVSRKFEIDILEPLRQEIIASILVKRLCRTDCAGVCARCGDNLNEGDCRCKKSKS